MASINKRGPYQWQAKIRRKGYPTQSKTFESYADALKWATEIEGEMNKGAFACRKEAENTTLDEALNRYKKEITPKKDGATQEKSKIRILKKSSLASRYLASIRSFDIAKYRDERLKTVKANTVKNDLILLSNLFTVARREWGMESLENPVANIERPKDDGARDRRLEPGEEKKLLKAITPSVKPAIILALETSMRRGEIAKLRWEHVRLDKKKLALPPEITKTKKGRDVPLSPRAIATLKALPEGKDDETVITVSASRISAAFHEACVKVKISDLKFHDLRHEAVSRLFEAGFGVIEVPLFSGHKTLDMLKRYTHLRAEDLAERFK